MSVIPTRGARTAGPLVQIVMLRAATLTIALAWPLWQVVAVLTGSPEGGFFDHWYLATTATMFFTANLFLFIAWRIGNVTFLVWVLRFTGCTLVVALFLLMFRPFTGEPGIWFIGFSGLPAVAFALTVSPVVGTTFYIATVGTLSLINAVMNGQSTFIGILANVSFGLLNTFPFIILAAATLRVSRVVDETDAEARRDQIRAGRLRARTEEMTGFTALVHDYVLSGLSSIARGVHAVNPLTANVFSDAQGRDDVAITDFMTSVRDVVREKTPGCTIEVDVDKPWQRIPSNAAANLLLALAEVVRNSASYADADAERVCTVTVDDAGAVSVTFTDDGPGFDPGAIRPTAAGIRVSVRGRMASVKGGEGNVESAPGGPTVARLRWVPETLVPEDTTDRRMTADPELSAKPLHQLLGMNVIFAWWIGGAMAVVFALLLVSFGNPAAPVSISMYLILVALIVLLIPEASRKLSLPRAVVIATGIPVVAVLGLWQQPWVADEGWLRQWHLSAVALVAVFLALRGRPVEAMTGIVAGAAAIEVIQRTGISPDTETNGISMLASSIIVIAAAMVNVGARYFLRRLPAARAGLVRAAAEAGAAEAAVEQRRSNLSNLRHMVEPVFDAADAVSTVTEPLMLRARLTELRLRDMLRSPLLNLPPLADAVQDARARGVKVVLLDDLSHNNGHDLDDARESVDLALGEFLTVLDGRDDGTVTIRVLPSGRNAFASVSDGESVIRLSDNGERIR